MLPARPDSVIGPRAAAPAAALGLALALAACVRMPDPVEPLSFAVDRAELDEPGVERQLAPAVAALRADPELHLLVVGHADEDNTEDYNRELSRRRAAHVEARLLALAPELDDRIHTEARGEWDASELGSDAEAKARNRRVELRYFYPRQCPPSFDAAFLACEWARLPAPEPATPPEPAPLAEAPKPGAEPGPGPRPRVRQDFRGPYVFGLGGYAVSSDEYLRQHARWGLGAGYIWGFGSEFRLAAGLHFDHLVDLGFVFSAPVGCAPLCDDIDRSRLRVVPELRIGGTRAGVWAWLRLSAGADWEHREALRDQRFDVATGTVEIVELRGSQWLAGAVLGIGPGVAITLTEHLLLLFDATVTYATGRGGDPTWNGAGIFDAGAGLGWVF